MNYIFKPFSEFPESSRQFLTTEVKIADLAPSIKEVKKAYLNTTLSEIIKIMKENNLHALPIFNKNQNNKLVKFVDSAEILCFVMEDFGVRRNVAINWKSNDRLNKVTCNQLMTHFTHDSRRNSLELINNNDFLQSAIELVCKYSISTVAQPWSVHHLAVEDDNNQIVSLLTQSRIVRFLAKNLEKYFPSMAEKSLCELDLVPKSKADGNNFHLLFKIHSNSSLLQAFLSCFSKRVTSVAVVNNEEKFIWSFRANQLAEFSSIQFSILLDTYFKEYLNDEQKEHASLCMPITTTLQELVNKMAETRLQSIFIVQSEEDKTCLGIVTGSDVLKLFKMQPVCKRRVMNISISKSTTGIY